NLKPRDRLEFLVGSRKAILLKKEIATLFGHILQCNKAGFVLIQALLQGSNRFFNGRAVFACWSFFALWTNKPLREDRSNHSNAFFRSACPRSSRPATLSTFASHRSPQSRAAGAFERAL